MLLKRNIYCLIIIVFGIFIIAWNSNNSNSKIKWLILKGGTLRVNGSTNINTFSCIVSDYTPIDTLYCTINKDASVIMNGKISLDIFGFDCHNPMMTLDLRKTLKAKDFPTMKINFLSLNKFPDLKPTPEIIKGWVFIELSGVTKKYEVSYKFSMDNLKVIHLIGDRSVNFSDFNITPPRKLGGIIKANDRLDVEFGLDLTQIPQ
jgi:hypothetical protein